MADYFTTLGYLVAIITILAVSIMPRGKFLQSLTLNALFACLGAATAVLILWSSLQARLHTVSRPLKPGSGLPPYNSSQAAVSALWLFVMIWFVNTLRAKFPALNVPVILYSIVVNIAATFSPIMTSTAALEGLIKRLLTAILAGLGLAAACSLLIIPLSSRKVTYGQMKGMIMLLRGAVKQEQTYMQSLEREDMFAVPQNVSCAVDSADGTGKDKKKSKKKKDDSEECTEHVTAKEATALRNTVTGVRELLGKLQADLAFAKRDVSWGKMEPCDLQKMYMYLRACAVPVMGMSTVIDIFQRLAKRRNWITDGQTADDELSEKSEDKRIWNEVMRQLHEPFEVLSEIVDQGLEHAGILLELLPKPKNSKQAKNGEAADALDVEANGGLVRPGDANFVQILEKKIEVIRVSTQVTRQNCRATPIQPQALPHTRDNPTNTP